MTSLDMMNLALESECMSQGEDSHEAKKKKSLIKFKLQFHLSSGGSWEYPLIFNAESLPLYMVFARLTCFKVQTQIY